MTIAFVLSSIRETYCVTLHETNYVRLYGVFGDMISPCFVKQAGDGDNFSLLAIHRKSIQSLKFEKAIIIFAFVKDLRLLKIISFVMLVNVDNFELFVEKEKNRSKWFVPLQERRNCFHKAGKHYRSIGQPYTADILVFISKIR